MIITFLGTGSAFTVGSDNFHSNMLITSKSKKNLLLDCGSDARLSLHANGYSYKDINAVFISHFHADHAGGMEWLGLTHRLDNKHEKPILFIKENMVSRLWDNVLSGGMKSFENEQTKLDTFFNVVLIKKDNLFSWENVSFNTIHTVHVMDDKDIVPSYGLFFSINGKNIFITFDTQFLPHKYQKYYKEADIIFHDCETCTSPTGVHSHFNQLVTLPETIRAKTWLYHYDPGELPDAKAAGFCGFIKPGQKFDFSK